VDDAVRRRRRVRHAPEVRVPVEPDPIETGASVARTAEIVDERAGWSTDAAEAGPVERGLRGLVGGGSSQVKPTAALRARDAARPRPDDLARAEEELTIVRRHWVPRD